MWRWVLALLAVSCGPTTADCRVFVTPRRFEAPAPPSFVAGRIAAVPIEVSLDPCEGQKAPHVPQDIRVDGTALDPDNRSTPVRRSSVEVVRSGDKTRVVAMVEFVPGKSGIFHVDANFEPSVGRASVDVVVARAAEPSDAKRIQGPAPCETVEVLSSGEMLCVHGNTLLVTRAAQLLQAWTVDAFALSGTELWTVTSNQLTRWHWGAVGFEASGTHALAADSGLPLMVAQPAGVVLLSPGSAARYRWNGTAILEEVRRGFSLDHLTGAIGAADLNAVIVAGSASDPREGGTEEFCRVSFEPGAPIECGIVDRKACSIRVGTPVICFLDDMQVMGADRETLWLGSSHGVRAIAFGDGGFVEESLDFSGLAMPGRPESIHLPALPALTVGADSQRRSVRRLASGIELLEVVLPDGLQAATASGAAARAQGPDAGQWILQ